MRGFHFSNDFPKRKRIGVRRAFTMLVSFNALNKSVGATNNKLAISFFLSNELVRVGISTKGDI